MTNCRIKTGNLLDVHEGIIVHGCNAHGVMGSGVAKAIREKWHSVYYRYNRRFVQDGLPLGSIQILDPTIQVHEEHGDRWDSPLLVVNAITQQDYGSSDEVYVSYEALELCLRQVVLLVLRRYRVGYHADVHMPMIGCGLARGDWDRVWAMIITVFQDVPCDVTVWKLP